MKQRKKNNDSQVTIAEKNMEINDAVYHADAHTKCSCLAMKPDLVLRQNIHS